MTHEQIDKLEGLKLDAAFAEAFGWAKGLFAHTPLDYAIAALPDGWRISLDSISLSGLGRGVIWIAEIMTPVLLPKDSPFKAKGPTPATALCRAALKAKGGELKADSCHPSANAPPCNCGWLTRTHATTCPRYKAAAEPAGVINPAAMAWYGVALELFRISRLEPGYSTALTHDEVCAMWHRTIREHNPVLAAESAGEPPDA